MSETVNAQTHQFQAEVQQVLDLMIHSLYSNKEIFLRELISNASDACDKLRFEALANDALYEGDSELRVEVTADEEARTVTIRDNGIGMTHDEVVDNIGTIARSGTRKFIEAMSGEDKADSQLIGQFGVGFYSAFIVADKVTLTTRRAGSEQVTRWHSAGDGEYTLEASEEAFARGTEVTLHLREGEEEFARDYRLRGLVSKYSDHIAFPIKMEKTVTEEEGEGDDKQTVERTEWEAVNRASALWTRSKNEIEDDEYQAFYKHLSHDFNDALTWAHNRVEGNQVYTTLLYLPSQAPLDMMMGRDERNGLKLYVKRVFIMDAAEQLLPTYLRFVRGVVDSDDLPLNVSRELLQDNALVTKIRAGVVKRVLDMIGKLDDEQFGAFYGHFGQVLKEGVVEDFSNREKILKLLRFVSTHDADAASPTVSLREYVERMKPEQDKIYYITADNLQAAKSSPHLEVFRKKGIEVLLLGDRVDEWMMGHLNEFDGKPMQSIAKGDLDLSNLDDEADKQAREETEKAAEGLVKRVSDVLGDRVETVRVSHRLTDSPACLVLSENDMAVHMQALLKQAGHDAPSAKATLEINPDHALVKRIDLEQDETTFAEWAQLLFDQALLAEGGQLEDPAGFVKRLNGLLMS